MKWDMRSLEIVSAKLAALYPEEWSLAAKEIRARNAIVKCSYTVHTDFSAEAACGWWPNHDPESNTVIVRNPFAGRRTMVEGRNVTASFIEIDADAASKILVLGDVPRHA